MSSNKLQWSENGTTPMLYAPSASQPSGAFRIAYDDVMYWPSWSKSCTQDVQSLKDEAQTIHDAWLKLC